MAFAAFAIGYMTLDAETANAGSRADARDPSVSGTIHPKLVDLRTVTAGSVIRDNKRAQLASLQTGHVSEFALEEPPNRSDLPSARSSFGERFSFDQPSAPSSILATLAPLDVLRHPFYRRRFSPQRPGSIRRGSDRRAAAPRVAAAVPVPRPVPRSGIAQATPKRPSESRFRLASASDTSVSLAYAPSDR